MTRAMGVWSASAREWVGRRRGKDDRGGRGGRALSRALAEERTNGGERLVRRRVLEISRPSPTRRPASRRTLNGLYFFAIASISSITFLLIARARRSRAASGEVAGAARRSALRERASYYYEGRVRESATLGACCCCCSSRNRDSTFAEQSSARQSREIDAPPPRASRSSTFSHSPSRRTRRVRPVMSAAGDAAASARAAEIATGTSQEDRFTLELEFVMALANPRYLHRARPPPSPPSLPSLSGRASTARHPPPPFLRSPRHPIPPPTLPLARRRPRHEGLLRRPRVPRVPRSPRVLDPARVRQVRALPARAVLPRSAEAPRVSPRDGEPARGRARLSAAVFPLAEAPHGAGGGGDGERSPRGPGGGGDDAR